MSKELPFKTKNKVLLAAVAVLIILSWRFAFSKTYEAVRHHAVLTRSSDSTSSPTDNPAFLQHRLEALNAIADRYRVDSSDFRNQFWIKVSSIAIRRDVEVIYRPDEPLSSDTTSNSLKESISFRGNFRELLMLLDSLERSDGIGKVVSLQFRKEKGDFLRKGTSKILLTADFKALPK